MRSNSYHCSKMRISRKQRKTPQCRLERQLQSAPSNFNNGGAGKAVPPPCFKPAEPRAIPSLLTPPCHLRASSHAMPSA